MPQTDKERREKKKNAEKKRRERLKANPEFHNAVKAEARNRYYKRKARGDIIPASAMNLQEKRAKQLRDRLSSKRYRERKKQLANRSHQEDLVHCHENPPIANDPISSTPHEPPIRRSSQRLSERSNLNLSFKTGTSPPLPDSSTRSVDTITSPNILPSCSKTTPGGDITIENFEEKDIKVEIEGSSCEVDILAHFLPKKRNSQAWVDDDSSTSSQSRNADYSTISRDESLPTTSPRSHERLKAISKHFRMPQTEKERREKKKNAEKKRRERLKANPEFHNAVKAQARNRYYRRKARGDIIPASAMNLQEKRAKQLRDRLTSKRYRERKKQLANRSHQEDLVHCHENPPIANDPISSTPHEPPIRRSSQRLSERSNLNLSFKTGTSSPLPDSSARSVDTITSPNILPSCSKTTPGGDITIENSEEKDIKVEIEGSSCEVDILAPLLPKKRNSQTWVDDDSSTSSQSTNADYSTISRDESLPTTSPRSHERLKAISKVVKKSLYQTKKDDAFEKKIMKKRINELETLNVKIEGTSFEAETLAPLLPENRNSQACVDDDSSTTSESTNADYLTIFRDESSPTTSLRSHGRLKASNKAVKKRKKLKKDDAFEKKKMQKRIKELKTLNARYRKQLSRLRKKFLETNKI